MPAPRKEVYHLKGNADPIPPGDWDQVPPALRPMLAATQFALGDITLEITNHTPPTPAGA